jgi:putative transposase
MRREGFEVNAKRVARVRREEGIKVRKRQRRLKRLGISTAERQRAERPGQGWIWGCVTDQTENGSCFRIRPCSTNTPDNCLAIHPGWVRAVDVITVVEATIARYGVPEHLRSDLGPAFIASCLHLFPSSTSRYAFEIPLPSDADLAIRVSLRFFGSPA